MTISLNQAKKEEEKTNNNHHKLQIGRLAQLAIVVYATDKDEIIQKGLHRKDKMAHV